MKIIHPMTAREGNGPENHMPLPMVALSLHYMQVALLRQDCSRSQPLCHIVPQFILARAVCSFARLVIVQATQRTQVR
jgi:hypothetical protein